MPDVITDGSRSGLDHSNDHIDVPVELGGEFLSEDCNLEDYFLLEGEVPVTQIVQKFIDYSDC